MGVLEAQEAVVTVSPQAVAETGAETGGEAVAEAEAAAVGGGAVQARRSPRGRADGSSETGAWINTELPRYSRERICC